MNYLDGVYRRYFSYGYMERMFCRRAKLNLALLFFLNKIIGNGYHSPLKRSNNEMLNLKALDFSAFRE